MSSADIADTLRQQLEYYRARAGEYDEWWLRQGRFDRGEEANRQWFAEGAKLAAVLAAFRPAGRVLELACGTGLWTEQLAKYAAEIIAVDGSPEVLAINASRLSGKNVRYVQADLFAWQPEQPFDVVFFSFWLSHVPPERFEAFWQLVRRCLKPGGRVFFIDSRREPTSTAIDHQLPDADTTVMRRLLNDGREYEVYKIFYEPAELTERLGRLGWNFDIRQTERFFLYGSGTLLAG